MKKIVLDETTRLSYSLLGGGLYIASHQNLNVGFSIEELVKGITRRFSDCQIIGETYIVFEEGKICFKNYKEEEEPKNSAALGEVEKLWSQEEVEVVYNGKCWKDILLEEAIRLDEKISELHKDLDNASNHAERKVINRRIKAKNEEMINILNRV